MDSRTLIEAPVVAKKPCACVPCHDRKVRCDTAVVGTPCTRCISRKLQDACTPVTRVNKRKNDTAHRPTPRKRQHGDNTADAQSTTITVCLPSSRTNGASLMSTSPNILPGHTSDNWGQDRGEIPTTEETDQLPVTYSSPRQARLDSPTTADTVEEEDNAHLHTLHGMSNLNAASPTVLASPNQGQHIVEYYGQLNSISVLRDVIGGRSGRKRLVHLTVPGPNTTSAQERELSVLSAVDRAYLNDHNIYRLPSKLARDHLLRLFFKHVFPYTPILDRLRFLEDYNQDTCSTFLLYAMFANVIPYASKEYVLELGFSDISKAQKEFFSRARLLFDSGCERGQLSLLQGSVLLSSFQNSFVPDKDFRFWFYNAVRIATQMGFHRDNVRDDLDPVTHKLCRRIWWILFSRDVLFNLSGFENMRRINDEETDALLPSIDDFPEEIPAESGDEILSPMTALHRHFFVENCRLAKFGAQFLRAFRYNDSVPPVSQAQGFAESLSAWRRALPPELSIDRVSEWNESNIWIIFLLAMSFRLECVFFRILRQRTRAYNPELEKWARQGLQRAIFELDTLLRRAMVHDVVSFCPPSLIICATNLIAFEIELALDPATRGTQTLTAITQIQTGLSYFRDVEARWINARWAIRVLEWVIKRAGLPVISDGSAPRCSPIPDGNTQGTCQPNTMGRLDHIDPNLSGVSPGTENIEGLADILLQALLDGNIFTGFDDNLLSVFGA
ncbi:fungal-specific transcription factor domain-containing protein [Bisporella sp. PMI_857]|nr:fungal-specific transcription factor domain-containing protein [Bisporella sp. PMI_857]